MSFRVLTMVNHPPGLATDIIMEYGAGGPGLADAASGTRAVMDAGFRDTI
jgi:hypothetical protein